MNAPDPIDVLFGTSLRARRTALRMSLEDLSGRIGVTYQQIQKYETGANRVSISMAARIAKAFGCPLAVLMKPIDDLQREPAPPSPSVANLKLADRPQVQFDSLPRNLREPLSALVEVLFDRSTADALPASAPTNPPSLAH
jgi:transcriptional regulator with XRE-family HTH domain